MKRLQHAVRLVAAMMLLAACHKATQGPWMDLNPPGEGGPSFHLSGTVSRLEVEGGLWLIKATDGEQYNIINLPKDFQVEGTPVEADARRRSHVVSNPAVGATVDLIRIRKR